MPNILKIFCSPDTDDTVFCATSPWRLCANCRLSGPARVNNHYQYDQFESLVVREDSSLALPSVRFLHILYLLIPHRDGQVLLDERNTRVRTSGQYNFSSPLKRLRSCSKQNGTSTLKHLVVILCRRLYAELLISEQGTPMNQWSTVRDVAVRHIVRHSSQPFAFSPTRRPFFDTLPQVVTYDGKR
jgi:hypothetical protein